MEWSTACPDWEQRIIERRSLVPFDPLFPAEAEAALAVFKSLRMVDVPGRPTFGEVCEPFVFDFVRTIFGAYDAKSGQRLISEFMLLISKKNGKSTIAAAIMLTALVRNWRDLAELIILAPTIKVAGNSFKPAAAMVRADPKLDAKMQIIANERTIRHRVTGAELRVVAADSGTAAGIKAGFVLIDELWLFGKQGNADAMLEEATGGLASRPEGFVIYLTTHSDEPPAGVFKEKLDYFRDVRDGKIADCSCFGMLFEWPESMAMGQEYLKPENYYVTNPNLGRSISESFITGKLRKAAAGEVDEDGDTGSLQVVLAKYLNVEIGMRLRRDRWGAADYWEAAKEPGLTIDDLLRRCEVAVVGIDGGGRDDLFGLCVAGRETGTGVWLACSRAWALEIALDRRKNIAPALRDFKAEGTLSLVETGQQLVDEVAALTVKVRDSGLMPAVGGVGVDSWGMGALVDALVAAGFDPGDAVARRAGQISPVSQGVGLTGTIKTAEFKLGDRMLRHDGSALMAWCVSNARAELKGSNVYISKQMAGAGKIDPLIAMLNALQMLEAGPVAGAGGAPTPWDMDPNYSMVAA